MTSTGMTICDLIRLHALAGRFVSMCASLFPYTKKGGLLYLACQKVHSIVHCASEIMRWGSLINCFDDAAEEAHKINVKGPGTKLLQILTIMEGGAVRS